MLNCNRLNTYNQRHSGGFTFIDLMIVFAVVAIAATLAMPVYQVYVIREKVTQCIVGAAPAKLSITEYRKTIDTWPPDAENASLKNNGMSQFCNGYVDYDHATGSFQVNVNESALGIERGKLQPQLTPFVTNMFTVKWKCSLGATGKSSSKYLPSSCREA
jgi:Tfp pilus assembly major pilin PilA